MTTGDCFVLLAAGNSVFAGGGEGNLAIRRPRRRIARTVVPASIAKQRRHHNHSPQNKLLQHKNLTPKYNLYPAPKQPPRAQAPKKNVFVII